MESAEKDKIDPILAAAIRVFLRQGYDAASMEEIAQEACVARRTLYNRFPDGKDALLTTAVSQLWDNWLKKTLLTEFAQDARFKKNARLGLMALGDYLYDFWTSDENLALIRILVSDPGRFPELTRGFFNPRVSEGYRAVIAYIRHLARAGLISVPDPVLAARHFTGLIRDPLFWRLLSSEEEFRPIARKKLVETSVNLFLEGCAP